MSLGKILLAATLSLLLDASAANAAPIATVEVVDGAVTVIRATGKRVALAVGSSLEEGDVVATEKDSYTRVRFTDGSEIAVRPQTTLAIQRYRFDQAKPAQDSLTLKVDKGGMRTVTGLIGKRGNENAYRVQGATATVSIRGTEYVLRECKNSCAADKQGAGPGAVGAGSNTSRQKAAAGPLPVAGRLVAFEGKVVIRDGNKTRMAAVGDPLYSGETIIVGSPGHAALVLNDQSRVVLGQGSEYQLSSVRFNPDNPARGNVMTDLIKGGLRMMTGTLGKKKPENVKVNTVVATIGVRGTNFDVWCVPSGQHRRNQAIQLPNQAHVCDQALYVGTREGSVEVESGEQRLIVPAGRVAYVDEPGGRPELIENAGVPEQPMPAPETLNVDHVALFGVDGSHKSDPGMYVSVKEGVVALVQANGEEMFLRRGEVGYAGSDGNELMRLETEPEFIRNDPYLREMNVDPSTCRAQ